MFKKPLMLFFQTHEPLFQCVTSVLFKSFPEILMPSHFINMLFISQGTMFTKHAQGPLNGGFSYNFEDGVIK